VFLTVHDIGTNHSSFRDFTELPCMSEFLARSIFIHLDLPGQEDHAPDYNAVIFPTLQQMGTSFVLLLLWSALDALLTLITRFFTQGEELVPKVLDELKVALIVGIGEGAGANVLVRFALAHQQRTLGKFA
jgi:protein NDRG1